MRKKQGLNFTKILIKAIIFPYKIHNAQVLLLKSYFLSTGTNEDRSIKSIHKNCSIGMKFYSLLSALNCKYYSSCTCTKTKLYIIYKDITVNTVLLIHSNYSSTTNKAKSKTYFKFHSINYCFKEDTKHI